MASVVESIHTQTQETESSVHDIVTRTLFLASVLGQKNVANWLKHERDGYSADEPVPPYRRLKKAVLVANQPGIGWVEAPITDQVNEAVSNFEFRISIQELESGLAASQKTGGRRLELPEDRQKELRKLVNLDAQLGLAVPSQTFAQVLDAVRIAIGLLTQELITAGVAGQGSSFRSEEREAARQASERLEDLLAIAAVEAEKRAAEAAPAKNGLLARLLGKH